MLEINLQWVSEHFPAGQLAYKYNLFMEYWAWPFPSNVLNLILFVTYLAPFELFISDWLEYLGTVLRHDTFLKDRSWMFRAEYEIQSKIENFKNIND